MTGRPPELATDTFARRLRALDAGDVARPEISWHGPARFPAARQASEATIQAMCGLMEVHGRDQRAPRRLGLEVASVAAGIVAAQGALAAAIAGSSREVRTSVLQAGLVLLSHYFVVATGLGDALPEPPLPAPGPPFRAAGGEWFEIETLDAESWKAFWTALGVAGADLGRGWHVFRLRYERATCSLPPGLHEATASRSLDELARLAAATQVSLTPLRSYAEVLADRPIDRATVQGRGDGTPPSTAEATGEPLAGIRMVEATSRIQGPFAGMLLRMLGMEVVRVQPPEGDYGRAAVTLHRGKDAVQLDLGSRVGRAQLADLVSGADVFLHNWRPGKAAEWGLEFEDLARRRPGLVYASLSGWGDRPDVGHLLGTDFLVQAYAGLGQGLNPEGEPPFPSRVILCDLFGALVAAEGVLTGLYRRARTGQAQDVRSSLLAGAMALQAHVLDDVAPRRPVWGPLDRPLATAEGYLMTADSTAIAGQLRERTAADWEEELLAAGVPAAVVCDDLATLPGNPRLSGLFEPVGGGLAPRSPWSFT